MKIIGMQMKHVELILEKHYPCEEIYFKKNTDIPLRSTQVVRRGWNIIQVTTYYKIISIGKPDEKYFDSIPKNWSYICRDVMLGLFYYPQTTEIAFKSKLHKFKFGFQLHHIELMEMILLLFNGNQMPLNVLIVLHGHQNNLFSTLKIFKKDKH